MTFGRTNQIEKPYVSKLVRNSFRIVVAASIRLTLYRILEHLDILDILLTIFADEFLMYLINAFWRHKMWLDRVVHHEKKLFALFLHISLWFLHILTNRLTFTNDGEVVKILIWLIELIEDYFEVEYMSHCEKWIQKYNSIVPQSRRAAEKEKSYLTYSIWLMYQSVHPKKGG